MNLLQKTSMKNAPYMTWIMVEYGIFMAQIKSYIWILRVAGTVLLFICEFRVYKMLGLKSLCSHFRTQMGTIQFLSYLIILTGYHVTLFGKGGWHIKYSWIIFRTKTSFNHWTIIGSELFGLIPVVFILNRSSLLMHCDNHVLRWRDFYQIVGLLPYNHTSSYCAPLKLIEERDGIEVDMN